MKYPGPLALITRYVSQGIRNTPNTLLTVLTAVLFPCYVLLVLPFGFRHVIFCFPDGGLFDGSILLIDLK